MPVLAAIGIVTRDMKESVRFYRLLGVAVTDPADDHLDARSRAAFASCGTRSSSSSSSIRTGSSRADTVMGLAFECSSPGEVNATHARAVAAGFRSKKDPWDAFWGQRYAQLIDPDDNVVDLFAQLSTATT